MSKTPSALAPGSKMPSAVYARVPLAIITSTIPNAGRGLAVLGDVKEGELIYSITNPPLCLVGDGFEKVSTTCDHCFNGDHLAKFNFVNALHPDSISLENEEEGLDLLAPCDKCKMVYYCNKQCQQHAWSHHHNAECAVLAELHRRFAFTEKVQSIVWGLTYRAVIRFMALRAKNMISTTEHDAYLALCTMGSVMEEPDALAVTFKSLSVVLEACLKAQVSEDEMMWFVDKFNTNRINLSTPILKSERTTWASQHALLSRGYCLEPFTSLINHTCEPNAHYFFEGNELRVRASKAIMKGEEITFSYLGQIGEYESRRQHLQRLWGIRCMCLVCTDCLWNFDFGFGRSPEILNSLRAAIKAVYENQPECFDSLLLAMGVMERTGLGYIIPSTLEAHQLAVIHYTGNGNVRAALKIALKIRYFIEPAQKPKMQLKDRLSTLFNIILLLQTPPQAEEVMPPRLLTVLRLMYIRGIMKCFGTDSAVYRHEYGSFVIAQQTNNVVKKEAGDGLGYASGLSGLHVDFTTRLDIEENRKAFVADMNKLLAWAGLEARTQEQLKG